MSEDEELLAEWLAGPGARPTAEDSRRWRQAVQEGRVPRIARSRQQMLKPSPWSWEPGDDGEEYEYVQHVDWVEAPDDDIEGW